MALTGVVLVISRGDLASLTAGGVGFGKPARPGRRVLLGALHARARADFPEFSPLRYTTLSAVAGTVSIVAITEVAAVAGWVAVPSAADVGAVWPELAFIVVMGALVAVLAWNSAVREIGPQNGALFINLVPVTAFAISIGGGYRPGAVELAGAGLTIAALVGGNLLARSPRGARLDRRPAARASSRSGGARPTHRTMRGRDPRLDARDEVLGLLAHPGAVLELERRQLGWPVCSLTSVRRPRMSGSLTCS